MGPVPGPVAKAEAEDDETAELSRVLKASASLSPSRANPAGVGPLFEEGDRSVEYIPHNKILPLVNLGAAQSMNAGMLQQTLKRQQAFFASESAALMCHGRGAGALDGELFELGIDTFASMHGTVLRRLVFFVMSWSILMVLLDLAFRAKLSMQTDCGFFQANFDDHCRGNLDWIIAQAAESSKYSMAVLTFGVYFFAKGQKVVRLQYSQWRRRAPPMRLDNSLWTCAASRDIFAETVSAVLKAHRFCAMLIGAAAAATSAVMLATNLTSQGLSEAGSEMCEGSARLCWLALRISGITLSLNMACAMWAFAVFSFTPLGFWSSSARDALTFTRNVAMKRLLNLQWAFMPSMLATAALLAIQCQWLYISSLGSELLPVFVWGNFSVLAYNVVVIASATGSAALSPSSSPIDNPNSEAGLLPGSAYNLRSSMRDRRPAKSGTSFINLVNRIKNASSSMSLQSQASSPSVTASTSGVRDVETGVEGDPQLLHQGDNLSADVLQPGWKLKQKEGSARMGQAVAAICMVYVLCIPQLVNSAANFAVVWVLRLLLLAVMALCQDSEFAQGDVLDEACPGMGLVIDAHQLRRAIEAHLKDEDFEQHIPFYKATLMRMHDTLAVSYRHQGKQVHVTPHLQLKMNEWQLQSLVWSLRNSNAKYVWIDTFSVPQYSETLRRTLLSRMMAVYASAGATLVLRSLEYKKSRYHQRFWCLQEFCSARTTRIATEIKSDGGNKQQAGKEAFNYHNAMLVSKLRRQVKEASAGMKPFWLYGSNGALDKDSAKEVQTKIDALSVILFCNEKADRLRALYPMMCGTSVENESELALLVEDAVKKAHCSLPNELSALQKAQPHG